MEGLPALNRFFPASTLVGVIGIAAVLSFIPVRLGLSAKARNGSLEEVHIIPVFRSSTAEHFGRIAPCYRELRDLDACVVRRVSRELERLSEGGCRLVVLDIGAGTGRYTEAVLRQTNARTGLCHSGVAYDAISKMLSTGAERRALGAGSINRVVGLAEFLPLATQSFNAVLSFNAVHHFDLVAFLDEAARVLRSNGRLVIYTRTPDQNRHTIWGQFFPHFTERETRLYTEGTLRAALDATIGFESPEVLEMRWMMHTSLPRLLDQARKGGYSTFQFYSSREFEEALGAFEIRVRARFDDPADITVPNDHLLVLVTHTAMRVAGTVKWFNDDSGAGFIAPRTGRKTASSTARRYGNVSR